MTWVLGTLAVSAVLAAIGVSVAGYRSTPPVSAPPGTPAAGARDEDPLAPRLFDKSGSVRIHVAGAVRKPGVYTLPAWARVVDAMKKAGGPTPSADLDAINLADFVRDGEQLRIPERGRAEPLSSHRPTPEPPVVALTVGGRGMGRYPFARMASAGESAGILNLNTATREDLESLPGVGRTAAERIVAYREQFGPFSRPEDLLNVPGIGEKGFERMRPLIAAP